MPRGPYEEADLQLVSDYLAKLGLDAVRFTKADQRTGKTPDFKVMRGGELVAYCEVKSPRDDWLDEQLDKAESFQIVGGARNDPTFNRIAALVHKAVGQLDAVNPDLSKRNILAVVNHDDKSGINDLRETLTGIFHGADGSRTVTMPQISEGRIKDEKRRIDLYLWFDRKTSKLEGCFFTQPDGARLDDVCALFGLDKDKIRR